MKQKGKIAMMEKIKMSFGRLTVKIALAAVIICFISQFLPWLTEKKQSMSLVEAFAEKPTYFAGMPIMLIVGLLWVAVWFLLNHPKLTLVGIVPLVLVALVLLMTASDFGLNLGIGFFLYVIALIVCVVMAFMTKKQRNNAA